MTNDLAFETPNGGDGYMRQEVGKKWFYSKTVWINLVGLIVFCATAFGIENIEVAEVEAAVLAVVNIGLRWFTGEPLK